MNKKELEIFAREAAKGLKTEKDLNEFSQFELNTPRDRHGSFEPQLVKIRQDRRIINKSVYLALGVKDILTTPPTRLNR